MAWKLLVKVGEAEALGLGLVFWGFCLSEKAKDKHRSTQWLWSQGAGGSQDMA